MQNDEERAWDMAVEYGGANEGLREDFLYSWKTHPNSLPFEYRFQGHFGFGGKLRYRGNGIFQADYYPEDKTPEREEKLAKLNLMLGGLDA
jgi:hypothetical protein